MGVRGVRGVLPGRTTHKRAACQCAVQRFPSKGKISCHLPKAKYMYELTEANIWVRNVAKVHRTERNRTPKCTLKQCPSPIYFLAPLHSPVCTNADLEAEILAVKAQLSQLNAKSKKTVSSRDISIVRALCVDGCACVCACGCMWMRGCGCACVHECKWVGKMRCCSISSALCLYTVCVIFVVFCMCRLQCIPCDP